MASSPRQYIHGIRLGGGNGVAFPQSEAGVTPAERSTYRYHCHQGHIWDIPFSADATPPETWDCPRCGDHGHANPTPTRNALRKARQAEQAKEMQRLRERRTDDELQALLDEALRLYRRQGYTFGTTGWTHATPGD